jgi:DNA-binding LacI/PurR family transcriptional regulator
MKGVLSVLDPKGYVVYMGVHFWDPERERRELKSMVKKRMEAIITVPTTDNVDFYNELVKQGVQLLFLQDEMEECPEISFCMWDAREAAKSCVRHLIETGHKRIGFAGVDHYTPWLKMRLEGFREAMQEEGMPIREDWICMDHREIIPTTSETQVHFGEAVEKLLRKEKAGKRPDAFLAMNDAVAMTTISVIRDRMHLSVPNDIAVVGMGDLAWAPLVGLSTAREPVEEVGRAAAQTTLNLIKRKGKTGQLRSLVSSDSIMVRDTTRQQ